MNNSREGFMKVIAIKLDHEAWINVRWQKWQILGVLILEVGKRLPFKECVCWSSVMSNSLQLHRQSNSLLSPWNSLGKNTGVGCHALLQEIFLTQGSKPGFSALQADSLPFELPRKPFKEQNCEKQLKESQVLGKVIVRIIQHPVHCVKHLAYMVSVDNNYFTCTILLDSIPT